MDAPAVAVSNDGKKIVVAWMDKRGGGNNRDVQWAISTRGKFIPETTVHGPAKGMQGHPTVVFDSKGNAWCAWEDSRSGPNAPRIYAINSKTPVNFRVSDGSEGKAGFPSLASSDIGVGVVYEAAGGINFRMISQR